jgi:uncharacterized protein YdaU (DUF1376 family)
MHYYYFHIGDYVTHTKHLTLLEDLAFRRLLDHYYLHEQPIRQREIARQIGMREYEQEVLSVLEEFFVSTEAGYINPRADKEIAKYNDFSEAGKRGAAKRWLKGGDSPPNAGPIATNNHKPITNNHNTVAIAPESVDNLVWEDFLKIRKAKKAPMTATALEGIKREATKAGWTLNDAIRECVIRGWQGFKADWVEARTVAGPDPGLAKLKEDEKLARPMPANIREMLQSAVKRMP